MQVEAEALTVDEGRRTLEASQRAGGVVPDDRANDNGRGHLPRLVGHRQRPCRARVRGSLPLQRSITLSLTGLLDEKGSPLRSTFQKLLPNTRAFLRELNDDLASEPLNSTKPTDSTLSGMALDYRLRYYFATAPPETTVAARGATLIVSALDSHGIRVVVSQGVRCAPHVDSRAQPRRAAAA